MPGWISILEKSTEFLAILGGVAVWSLSNFNPSFFKFSESFFEESSSILPPSLITLSPIIIFPFKKVPGVTITVWLSIFLFFLVIISNTSFLLFTFRAVPICRDERYPPKAGCFLTSVASSSKSSRFFCFFRVLIISFL